MKFIKFFKAVTLFLLLSNFFSKEKFYLKEGKIFFQKKVSHRLVFLVQFSPWFHPQYSLFLDFTVSNPQFFAHLPNHQYLFTFQIISHNNLLQPWFDQLFIPFPLRSMTSSMTKHYQKLCTSIVTLINAVTPKKQGEKSLNRSRINEY